MILNKKSTKNNESRQKRLDVIEISSNIKNLWTQGVKNRLKSTKINKIEHNNVKIRLTSAKIDN